MPQPLFDVFFRGALLPDADADQVRERLAALFGLGPAELGRLFGGDPVCVKRAVDVDTASHLRGRFRDAGALVDIRPAEATPKPSPPAAPEPDAPAPTFAIDTSHLSVAPPNTGSLEDCHREKPARPIGDISHLSLSDD